MRRMIVMNEPQATNAQPQQQVARQTGGKTTHFSPIGPLQLTAEECNEILMKRAATAAAAANNQLQLSQAAEAQHGQIQVQVDIFAAIFSAIFEFFRNNCHIFEFSRSKTVKYLNFRAQIAVKSFLNDF